MRISFMNSERPIEYPDKPEVRPGVFVYQAPAPVKITIGNLEVILGERDTTVIDLSGQRPEELSIGFDWNIEEVNLASRYRANERYGQVDVWYERQ